MAGPATVPWRRVAGRAMRRWQTKPPPTLRQETPLAAVLRLGAFLALVAVLFLLAYAAGRGVGPVTLVHGHPGGPGMHMGAVRLGVRR